MLYICSKPNAHLTVFLLHIHKLCSGSKITSSRMDGRRAQVCSRPGKSSIAGESHDSSVSRLPRRSRYARVDFRAPCKQRLSCHGYVAVSAGTVRRRATGRRSSTRRCQRRRVDGRPCVDDNNSSNCNIIIITITADYMHARHTLYRARTIYYDKKKKKKNKCA